MSYVYILTNSSFPGIVKIGYTDKHPRIRAQELHTTGVPSPFIVFKLWEVKDGKETERDLHNALRKFRKTNDREFFRISPEDAEIYIEDFLTKYDDFTKERKLKEEKEKYLRKIYNEWENIRKEVRDKCFKNAENNVGITWKKCLSNKENALMKIPIIGILGIFYTTKGQKRAEELKETIMKKSHDFYLEEKINFFQRKGHKCKAYSSINGYDTWTFIENYIIHEHYDFIRDWTSIKIKLCEKYKDKDYLELQDSIIGNRERVIYY